MKEGDVVRAGQPIGEPGGFVSAAVHAPISGKVTAILPHLHPAMATLVPTVVIETPEGESPDGGSWPAVSDWSALSVDELRARIRDAGVVGLGGAAFPTHVKLTPPKEKRIDALILNGVECEPFLTADHRLMLEQADAVIGGRTRHPEGPRPREGVPRHRAQQARRDRGDERALPCRSALPWRWCPSR